MIEEQACLERQKELFGELEWSRHDKDSRAESRKAQLRIAAANILFGSRTYKNGKI